MISAAIIFSIVWILLILAGVASDIYTAHWHRKVIDAQRELIKLQDSTQEAYVELANSLIIALSEANSKLGVRTR